MPVGIKPQIHSYHIRDKVGSRMTIILFTKSGTKVAPGLPSFYQVRDMTNIFT